MSQQPDTASQPQGEVPKKAGHTTAAASKPPARSRLHIPPALKALFDRFPLQTLPAHVLPARSPADRSQNVLYIFTSLEEAESGAPSFNPGCLRWQTILRMKNIRFSTRPSNNHASSTGSLPFLIPGNSPPNSPPIPSAGLQKWITEQTDSSTTTAKPRPSEAPYSRLVSFSIRQAYLYSMYLDNDTFSRLTSKLYIHTASSSSFVRLCLSMPLRKQAAEELYNAGVSGPGHVDADGLFYAAEASFQALSVLLGESQWFATALNRPRSVRHASHISSEWATYSTPHRTRHDPPLSWDTDANSHSSHHVESESRLFDGDEDDNNTHTSRTEQDSDESPGMLDAAVFAYTYCLTDLHARALNLDKNVGGMLGKLSDTVHKHKNLVQHRDRVLQMYF